MYRINGEENGDGGREERGSQRAGPERDVETRVGHRSFLLISFIEAA